MKDYTDSQLDELYTRALDAAADSQASEIDVEQALLTLKHRILNDDSVSAAEAAEVAQPAPSSPPITSNGSIIFGAGSTASVE